MAIGCKHPHEVGWYCTLPPHSYGTACNERPRWWDAVMGYLLAAAVGVVLALALIAARRVYLGIKAMEQWP